MASNVISRLCRFRESFRLHPSGESVENNEKVRDTGEDREDGQAFLRWLPVCSP